MPGRALHMGIPVISSRGEPSGVGTSAIMRDVRIGESDLRRALSSQPSRNAVGRGTVDVLLEPVSGGTRSIQLLRERPFEFLIDPHLLRKAIPTGITRT